MKQITATAMTEPARPKLVLKKRVVVDVAALKASQPTASQPSKPTKQANQSKPTKPTNQANQSKPTKKPVKTEKQLAHEERMRQQEAAAAEKRAAKEAIEAAKKAAEAAQRAKNRLANEEAEKRAKNHRKEFESIFNKLTIVGCKKPLAVNSDLILLEYARRKIPEITLTTVRGIVGKHCAHANYLTILSTSAGKPRYHPMSGEIMGEVTEEQARTAGERLESRRAARRAAKEAARQGSSALAKSEQVETVEL